MPSQKAAKCKATTSISNDPPPTKKAKTATMTRTMTTKPTPATSQHPSVEVIPDIDDDATQHHGQPKNPNCILELSSDEGEDDDDEVKEPVKETAEEELSKSFE